MALMRKIAQAQADAAAARTPAPLAICTAPWPGDVRLVVHAQPTAPLGQIAVQLGLGKGTRGRGQRAGDDHALIVATARRLAAHLTAWAADYEQAAMDDADAAPDAQEAATAPLQPCTYCGVLSPWPACGDCIPF